MSNEPEIQNDDELARALAEQREADERQRKEAEEAAAKANEPPAPPAEPDQLAALQAAGKSAAQYNTLIEDTADFLVKAVQDGFDEIPSDALKEVRKMLQESDIQFVTQIKNNPEAAKIYERYTRGLLLEKGATLKIAKVPSGSAAGMGESSSPNAATLLELSNIHGKAKVNAVIRQLKQSMGRNPSLKSVEDGLRSC